MTTTLSRVTLPKDREPTFDRAHARDTNFAGNIFGADPLSGRYPQHPGDPRARGRVTTVAVNSVEFHQPVFGRRHRELLRPRWCASAAPRFTVQTGRCLAERNPARSSASGSRRRS